MSFSDLGEDQDDSNNTKEGRIAPQKTVSFKEGKHIYLHQVFSISDDMKQIPVQYTSMSILWVK